jgi:hypothetical protein
MTTPENQSAFDLLRAQLAQWGIGQLATDVQGYLTGGLDANQALLKLRETDAYKARFAGNALRLAKGLAPLSEGE